MQHPSGRSRAALPCLVLTLGAGGCATHAARPLNETPSDSAKPSLAITYALETVAPPSSFRLELPASGDADLWIYEPPSGIASDTVGEFRAAVPASMRAMLGAHVRGNDLIDASFTASATSDGSGVVALDLDGTRKAIGLATDDPPVVLLRNMLDRVVSSVAEHPVAALRATATAEIADGAIKPVLVLTRLGSAPLPVWFFDAADPSIWLRASVDVSGPKGESRRLSREDVARAVATGALPGGRIDVPAGAVYRVALPEIPCAPCEGITLVGSARFWIPGEGASKNVATVSAAPIEPGTSTKLERATP